MGYSEIKKSAEETLEQKKQARAEFLQRKRQVMRKIEELKRQGRSVEEIYKYTADIIPEVDSARYDDEPPIRQGLRNNQQQQ